MADKKPMPDLLPCPFCGTEPDFSDCKGTQLYLSCENCGCEKSVQIIDCVSYEERYAPGNDFNNETMMYPQPFIDTAMEELIAAWNTRADLCAKDGGEDCGCSHPDRHREPARQELLGGGFGCYCRYCQDLRKNT